MNHSEVVKKNIKQESSTARKSLISLFIGLCSFITVLIISSFVIMNVSIQAEYLFIFVLTASGISAIVCSTSVCIQQKHRILVFSVIISLILAIIEFLIILCFNNVRFSHYVYLLFPIMILCSFISCIIVLNLKKN